MSTWQTPKENWVSPDGILYTDFNRIEGNINYLADLTKQNAILRPYINGFNIETGSTDGEFTVGEINGTVAGLDYCVDDTGVYGFGLTSYATKLINASDWVAGNNQPCRAPGITINSVDWVYLFAIHNPTTGATDIQIDTSAKGTSISAPGYIYKRRIGALKVYDDGGTIKICPTISRNNYFYYGGAEAYRKATSALLAAGSANAITLNDSSGVGVAPGLSGIVTGTWDVDTSLKGSTTRVRKIWPYQFGNAVDVATIELRVRADVYYTPVNASILVNDDNKVYIKPQDAYSNIFTISSFYEFRDQLL